ncbi:aldo/keto reductase [Oscillatoria amoena NRMC-F 0135]|nr:aldo/keto reductase [Oscillatoria amoena NRMC-F 0135]
MKYRQLGNTGIYISEIGMGMWLNFKVGGDKDTMYGILNRALDNGINFFDTADMYYKGESEKVLGDWMAGKNRQEIVVATKVFGPMSNHWMAQGLSMRHIRNACEDSLQRLRTDYIDLYQCHRYDIDTPLEETCYAMHNLVERGYILHWGVSQWTAVQILNALRICERNGWRKPISNQPIYNMLNRSLEVDVMDVCHKEGLGLVCYSPLAQGLLTGKYTPDTVPDDSRMADESIGAFFPRKRMTDEFFDMQEQLKKVAQSLDCTMLALALAWALSKKPVTSLIIGASRPAQVDDNCAAIEVEISAETDAQIEEILQNAPVDQYSGVRVGWGIVKRGY